MKILLLLAIVGAASVIAFDDELPLEAEWDDFKITHDKEYDDPDTESFRRKVFEDNSRLIAEHNGRYARGEVSYTLGINEFGDLMHHEFLAIMNIRALNDTEIDSMFEEAEVDPDMDVEADNADVALPSSVDWRRKGAVTGVKNQGQCGSCWAFSASGSIEGQAFKRTRRLVSLSEQNLLDCTRRYGNYGCRGGFMTKAFAYVRRNGGIDTERGYPYEAVERQCRYRANQRGATIRGFSNVQRGNEGALSRAIAFVGPIAIAMDAHDRSFQFYRAGIYAPASCSATRLSHAMLAVGYGRSYYAVKNSWGRGWGSRGYVFMARNRGNKCGIATMASYPLV